MNTVEQKIKQVFEEIEAIKKAKPAPFLRCRQVIAGSVEEAIEIVGLVKTIISNNDDHSYLDNINLFAGASFGNCVMIQSKL